MMQHSEDQQGIVAQAARRTVKAERLVLEFERN